MVTELARRASPASRVLEGACDPWTIPRPLGPLADIAPALGIDLDDLHLDRSGGEAFAGVMARIGRGQRADLIIFEDVQWADQATLHLLAFLGRRVTSLKVLIVATYRDDEVGPEHPLTVVLGDLATASNVERLTLPPLSLEGVVAMCRDPALDAREIRRVTGGNPFFLSEVIGAGSTRMPATVRDAVLARASRVAPDARSALDVLAIIGIPAGVDLVARVMGEDSTGMDGCLASGLVRKEGEHVAFRHELARSAIEGAIPSSRRRGLHRAVLEALRRKGGDPSAAARLVRHAEAAGDDRALLELAPQAAAHAAALHSHREAGALYGCALTAGEGLTMDSRARLLESCAFEQYLSGDFEGALSNREEAIACWRSIGDRLKEGEDLCWVSRLSMMTGRAVGAAEAGVAAIAILERLLPGSELAMAYNNQAWLRMLASDVGEAVSWGRRAVELARRLHDRGAELHAAITVAAAEFQAYRSGSETRLEECLHSARREGLEEQAGRAYWNLACVSVWHRRYPEARRYVDEGIDYCLEHELHGWRLFLLSARARLLFDTGAWDGADAAAADVLRHPGGVTVRRKIALVVRGRVAARRGDVGASWQALDEALALSEQIPEMHPFAPVRPARAEAAWLEGNRPRAIHEAQMGHDEAAVTGDRWELGEAAYWMWRAGGPTTPAKNLAEPFAQAIAGDLDGAVLSWRFLGCPYEEAETLALRGDAESLHEALTAFARLGAAPAVAMCRQQLRGLGITRIPRGPRPSTRQNAAGLTRREVEVLRLVSIGLTNPELAMRLFVSRKTVEHHLSTIMSKLDAGSRAAAVTLAQDLGIL